MRLSINALLWLVLVCSAPVHAARYDCSTAARGCSGHGECGVHRDVGPLAVCTCEPGFAGASCGVPPPRVPRAWRVPGQVTTARPAYYRVEQWRVGDTLELEWLLNEQIDAPSELVHPILVARHGRVPTRERFDAAATPVATGQSQLVVPDAAPGAGGDGTLYLAVFLDDEGASRFSLTLDRFGEKEVLDSPTYTWPAVFGGFLSTVALRLMCAAVCHERSKSPRVSV